MSEIATKSLESPEDRRVKLVLYLAEELHQRGYNFFNFDGCPVDTPALYDNSFEFARGIRRLPDSGFLWKDKNYSVQVTGKFDLEDPFKVEVAVKGRDELGVIESMVSSLNARYSLKPRTEFGVTLKSPDYEIWTTLTARQLKRDKKLFEAAKRDRHSF
ncbi:MAG: hypothetical protein AABX35_02175 [Nanoarchaeota archaeon]